MASKAVRPDGKVGVKTGRGAAMSKFWTAEKVKELTEMCYREVPNKKLAEHFNCDINQIYAKRSQLGITIDKCKANKKTAQ